MNGEWNWGAMDEVVGVVVRNRRGMGARDTWDGGG